MNSPATLHNFLQNVPRSYSRFIKKLDLNLAQGLLPTETVVCSAVTTEDVISLLLASPCLEQLSLQLSGSLDKRVIPCFSYLPELTHLSVKNCADDTILPLCVYALRSSPLYSNLHYSSERLVVSIAASLPNIHHLSLDRVSRSLLHAPELVGVYPYIPLVSGDADIPDHPLLGENLYLPSLLQIPTLKELVIRDTHLGDERWSTTPVACHLQVLDLGSCDRANEDSNRQCIERIMSAVGPTVDEFSLMTSVSDAIFAERRVTPLQSLRKLHISPFFPVDSVVDTFSNLAGSPIESVSMQCYEDDVVDVCSALEEFLALRVARGSEFYDKLARIDVTVAANDDSTDEVDLESCNERAQAMKRLQDFCRDLRLASQVRTKTEAAMRGVGGSARLNVLRPSGVDGRVRAMTI